jgi:imidazolonepropionase
VDPQRDVWARGSALVETATQVDLAVVGAGEILTCSPEAADLVGRIEGDIAIKDGKIVAVGDISNYVASSVVDASGGVVMPGFVDAHTHVVFGRSRSAEYSARVAGRKPPPGASVGIVGTTRDTRAATFDQLFAAAANRIESMLLNGTTTVESKSGYGLDRDTERRLLEVNQYLNERLPVDVVSTFLGAHAVPPGAKADEYVDDVVEILPLVYDQGIAEFCDVYCDDGYFTLDQTRRIFECASDVGMRVKLHLDAYGHTGAAELAIEHSAVSVDHLNYTSDEEVAALADAGVVGVYMPCLEYLVDHPRPVDPRRLLAHGMELALATDFCPACWTPSMQLVIAMACRAGGISVEHAIRAATIGAARAIGEHETVGSIEPEKRGDLIILDTPTYEDLAYRFGVNNVSTVIVGGSVWKQPKTA